MFEDYETPDDELEQDEIELRNACRNLTDDEFYSITPIWCTKESDFQYPWTHPKNSENLLVECDTAKLIKSACNIFNIKFTRLFNKNWNEDGRFCNTLLNRWQKGLGVDPPEVNFVKDGITISDGRHRAVLANELKAEKIIVRIRSIDKEEAVAMLGAKVIEV